MSNPNLILETDLRHTWYTEDNQIYVINQTLGFK